jgi:hypothetical protein
MTTALRQTVTVKRRGRVEITAPGLPAGTRAEVIVLVDEPLERLPPRRVSWPVLTAKERRAARRALVKFCGTINSGDPDSANNERIDRDLAREYGSTHEEGNE